MAQMIATANAGSMSKPSGITGAAAATLVALAFAAGLLTANVPALTGPAARSVTADSPTQLLARQRSAERAEAIAAAGLGAIGALQAYKAAELADRAAAVGASAALQALVSGERAEAIASGSSVPASPLQAHRSGERAEAIAAQTSAWESFVQFLQSERAEHDQ